MTIKELESQLTALSPAEKVEVFQLLAHELGDELPGIEKTPGVAGGEACIVRTRLPVWALEGYRRLGWNDQRILDNYPTLRRSDLVNAWAYVNAHPEEIERALEQNEMA